MSKAIDGAAAKGWCKFKNCRRALKASIDIRFADLTDERNENERNLQNDSARARARDGSY